MTSPDTDGAKMPRRLPIAFVGSGEMFENLFPTSVRTELQALEGVEFFHDSGAERTARETVLAVTGWGSPRFNAPVLSRYPHLQGIVHATGSIRPIVTDDVWRRGIEVCNNANLNAIPVAEYTFAMVVAAAKGILPPSASGRPAPGTYGLTVGIVGASRIGRATIKLLRALDALILLYDPYVDGAEAASLGATRVDLPALMRQSDVVSLHVPALDSTRHLIGEAELRQMRPGATLINTARGAVVDTDALVRTLREGSIQAILDVTDPDPLPCAHPLRHLPNVTVTPHVAGSMGRELWRLGSGVVENVRDFIQTGHLPHQITRELLEMQA
ncbi:phosphoglycerate dehydrogenase-like enzyme [Curtobacterium flaccumfaciens]|nr:hydroxyacid dehydrogenase [Curtobacterium flaccumfaciens]MDQ0540938.1 phosphoglycerate dehydrogenase-like enzyme [Curtobacterium flaccumfaciens]